MPSEESEDDCVFIDENVKKTSSDNGIAPDTEGKNLDVSGEVSDISWPDQDESVLLDETRPLTASPFLDETRPLSQPNGIMRSHSQSPRKPLCSLSPQKGQLKLDKLFSKSPSSAKTSDLNETKDLFSSSQDSSQDSVILLSSPEKSVSPPKSKSSTLLVHRPNSRQGTIDKFLVQKSQCTSGRRRNQQSKMDLFVKWKDPTRLEFADNARQEFFKSSTKRREQAQPGNRDDEPFSPPKKRSSQENMTFEGKPTTSAVSKREESLRKKSSQKTYIFAPSCSSATAKGAQSLTLKKSSQNALNIMKDHYDEMKQREQLMKGMLDESFTKKHHSGNLLKVQEEQRQNLKDGEVIRQKADRDRMHATDCPCCKEYFDALDLTPDSKQKRIQQVGRHRYVELPKPKTPEHYWDIGFPSESEQKRRGYIKVKSPKKIAKKLFDS